MKKILVPFVLITLYFTQLGESQSGGTGGRSSVFNVMDFGARGVSPNVDTQAFLAAWGAACKVSGGVVLVPSGNKFTILPVEFSGSSCQPNVVFQVDGSLSAPPKSAWNGGVNDRWLCFNGSAKGLAIRGVGSLDGNGRSWWPNGSPSANTGFINDGQGDRPHMILVAYGTNVTISGITLTNSPKMHIFVYGSQQVEMSNVKVTSPGNSPNTDGIHVSNTQHVRIHHSNISCGDDCVSIQTGCSDIRVYNVHCNPGHGFSIGGLGDQGTEDAVSDVLVTDSTVSGAESLTGVRIKTWPGGSGYVRNVTFSNIQVSEVGKAIVIDQHYSDDGRKIANSAAAVAISGVTYENITGTYRTASIVFDCSEYQGCRDITIRGVITLKPIDSGAAVKPNCSHASGKVFAMNPTPPLDGCLT
ncbi:polygalacturonase [Dorcoceras hygrometricum]|uniref:Polygalacturonase n=1 Tax=Dorcoceras hygrometricum TaxID=472368 RepID=A0A2Z7BF27_9LAMI|nr:polygalacturonase [Dorcoceras hygrometricum]